MGNAKISWKKTWLRRCKKLISLEVIKHLLYINLSEILPKIYYWTIIYYKRFVFFFKCSTYICFFPNFWKFPFFSYSWKIIFNGKVIDALHIFIILIDKLSYPCASVNLYLPLFSRKIAWSYKSKDTLSTQNPTRPNTKNQRK